MAWVLFIVVAAWTVLCCLQVIAREYHNAVAWHDLRVRVQRLRRDQTRRLEDSTETEPSLRRIFGGRRNEVPSLMKPADAADDAVEVLDANAA